MGPRLLKIEALQTDGRSEKAKLGFQYPGTGCLPTGAGAPKDTAWTTGIGRCISRATMGRHALGSAYAGAGAGQWQFQSTPQESVTTSNRAEHSVIGSRRLLRG